MDEFVFLDVNEVTYNNFLSWRKFVCEIFLSTYLFIFNVCHFVLYKFHVLKRAHTPMIY
jgi:hypothetical protein